MIIKNWNIFFGICGNCKYFDNKKYYCIKENKSKDYVDRCNEHIYKEDESEE